MSGLNIVVCVKQVLDTRLAIEVSGSGGVVQKEPWPVYLMNPADRCGLEEAIRLRDEIGDGCVTAITLGQERAESVLAHCLGRGVDRAVHLELGETIHLDSFGVAQELSTAIRSQNFDLILCGNKAEDDGAAEVGPVLAELLDIPQVTNVVKLNVSLKDKRIVAERKLERGYRQIVEVQLPAVITVDSSFCQPRYVTVRARNYAAKSLSKKADRICIEHPGLIANGSPLRKIVDISPPRPRPKKIIRADSGTSAANRMAMLMGLGGTAPKKPAQRSTGGPESLADEIIAFLKEKGLLE